MILLTLAAATLHCPPGTKQARQHGKPKCVAIKGWVAPPAIDRMTPRGPFREYAGKRLFHNSYPAAPVDGVVIEKTRAVCATSCIWAGRASKGWTIRDVELTRVGLAGPSEIDAGIKVGGSKGGVATAGVLIKRAYIHGWGQVPHKGYANGDGLVINRGVINVTVRDSRFDNNADAGIDTKANLTVLDNVSAADNGHYGFRFWGKVEARTLYAARNAWGAVQAEAGAHVTIAKLVVEGGEEIVTAAKGAIVVVQSCDLTRWAGAKLTKGTGTVTLGPGCKLP